MATAMAAYESIPAKHMGGIRVVLCDPDHEVRASVRSAIENDSALLLVAESHNWAACEIDLDNLVPELLIVRSNLVPFGWTRRLEQDLFSPVVITLRQAGPQAAPFHRDRELPVPVEPAIIRMFLNKAVMEIYDRKVKQLLDLVERYVAGSGSVHSYNSVITAEQDGQRAELPTDSIMAILAARKYVSIITQHGKFMLREPIHHVAATLDSSMFIRIHRSIIVNRRHVDRRMSSENRSHLVLVDGSRYPVGPNYRDAVASLLDSAS